LPLAQDIIGILGVDPNPRMISPPSTLPYALQQRTTCPGSERSSADEVATLRRSRETVACLNARPDPEARRSLQEPARSPAAGQQDPHQDDPTESLLDPPLAAGEIDFRGSQFPKSSSVKFDARGAARTSAE